ncbi:MAG: alpha/beta fold hydrolase [Methanobacteriaceae archaeon]|nr:alpha/beta fold hydrolase [Methanobacteriaceae archaeon]
MLKPQYKIISNFEFTSGEILPEIVMEYATQGIKRIDEKGNITNAILFLHGWSGDYTSINRLKDVIGPGKAVDTDKYFIISTTALGSPGSSSPSTTRLGVKFPKYSVKDMVNVQFRLLSEHLKVKKLKGVIGTSMGGFLTLNWATDYPNYMDFIIPIVTSYDTKGRNFAINSLMNLIIERDPDYQNGKYEFNPKNAVENASMLLYLFAFSPEYYKKEFETNEILYNNLVERGVEGQKKDANDIIWRNNALNSFNIKEDLYKIKVKTLIIGVKQDPLFPPETDTIPLHKEIKQSKLFLYDSSQGHLGINELIKAENVIKEFLSEIR